MKLKKLEITGFKSFVDKTVIHFPPGVSAVVGPNGCGKSNIVDALRWVMGEQSVRQLRGKTREDVIFAGAEGKPPLNMAEVTLTLINDNGTIPEQFKDYTEIEVTRRLYRSGESAYLVNRRQGRLKDIHNIFSGMGPRAYAVIQQGNVGAITEADPDQRRVFIEEAAGVTRYKNRKTEALRKVASTEQNLLRLLDIIGEVQRQMKGLKRQAKKARVYKSYQRRIRHTDITASLMRHDEFSRQIQKTENILSRLKDADLRQSADLDRLDAAMEEIRLLRLEKQEALAVLQEEKNRAERTFERKEAEFEHLGRDLERLKEEIRQLGGAEEEARQTAERVAADLEKTETEGRGLKEQSESVQLEIQQERDKGARSREILAQKERLLEDARESLIHLTNQEARFRQNLENSREKHISLSRRRKLADEEALRAERDLAAAEKKAAATEERMNAIRADADRLEEEARIFRRDLEEKNRDLAGRIKAVQTLALERNGVKSEHAALKKMQSNFDWYKDGVKAVMTKAKDPDFPLEALGLLADGIEPAPSHELAVEAALGDALQHVLVKDGPACLDWVNALGNEKTGRVGFIPLSGLKPVCPEAAASHDPRAILGHVKAEKELQPVLEALVGHVLVADDLQQALAVWRETPGSRAVVTRKGEQVTLQGAVVGGGDENFSGILAKKRQLKDLSQKLDRLDRDLEKERQLEADLTSEVRSLENELQQVVEEKNRCLAQLNEAEKALYKDTENLKTAQKRLEICQLDVQRLDDEEVEAEEEVEKYAGLLEEMAASVEKARTAATDLGTEIADLKAGLEKEEVRLTDLKMELTALTTRMENARREYRQLKGFHAESLSRLDRVRADMEAKTRHRQTAMDQLAQTKEALAALNADLQALEGRIQSREADFYDIDVQLKEGGDRISGIQVKREKTMKKVREMEVIQSRLSLRREAVENRLEELYHAQVPALRAEIAREPVQGAQTGGVEKLEALLESLRKKKARIGEVNLSAISEYEDLKKRCDFLLAQQEDLIKALDDLRKVIAKINRITQKRFLDTFEKVNEKLGEVFPRLFTGGSARLELTMPNKPLETGVEFLIHPPGKKLTRMSLLSGGEKALAAIAFIFSIFLIKPTSFCLMDEIDAPLDDANVHRFNDLLKLIGEKSQIIMITHNKRSMEFADTLFGITMEKKGVSKVVSVNFGNA